MKKCCANKTGVYCSDCGSELSNSSLRGLLVHVRRTARAQREGFKLCEHANANKRDVDTIKYLSKKKVGVERWESWVNALDEILRSNKQGTKPPR